MVFEVPSERLSEVVEVLAEAFFNYEAMRYFLGESGDEYATRLRSLIGYFAGSRVAVGSPILGVTIGPARSLVAVAVVDPPHSPPRSGLDDLARSIGEEALARIHSFGMAIAPLEPDYGFYYLGMVGVRNEHRGKRYAKLLINRIAELSELHPDSRGVLLTTEHESNLALYQSIGFVTLGDAVTADGGLQSWTMFRPDGVRTDHS